MRSLISAHQYKFSPFKGKPICAESLAPVRLLDHLLLFCSKGWYQKSLSPCSFALASLSSQMILEYLFCFLVFWFWDKVSCSCNWDWPWTHFVVEDDFELLICLSLLPRWWLQASAAHTPCWTLRLYLNVGHSSPSHPSATPSILTSVTSLDLVSLLLVILRPFQDSRLKHPYLRSGCSYSVCLSWNRGLRASSD